MAQPTLSTAPTDSPQAHQVPRSGPSTVPVLVLKIFLLAVVVSTVIALTPALVAAERWGFLVVFWLIALAAVAVYATRRLVPLKYLFPGVLLLLVLVIYPVISTMQLSFTNYGDGTRTTKDETIAQILGASVVQTPDAPRYNLTVATTGSATTGPFTFLLVDPDGQAYAGTAEGLEPLEDATVSEGFVTEADGLTLLKPTEVNDAAAALQDFAVPTETGAIRQLGIRQAFEGSTPLEYDEASDTITNTDTGAAYTPVQQGDREYFVDGDGNRLSDQSWGSGVGFGNYVRIFTDSRIFGNFIGIFTWTVVFAAVSVASTFVLGMLLALTLNDSRVKGQKIYRSLLLLPYAIPGFIALLVWSGFWNTDYGLVNDLTGLSINWLGNPTTAKIAVLLTNLWLGFPYMFLVVTGALQSVPEELTEAADIDGASGFTAFRKITFPLLLIPTAPLLVASFAFNFNNFNAVQLLTGGGPFTPDNPTAGGTDILISYTVRLAFGASGAQFGFASAIAVLLFILTGLVAAIQFRYTARLEDVA